MSLEKVVKEIIAKGECRAEEILKGAENEKERILQSANDEAERIRKSREAELKELRERLEKQELSSAELEVKRMHLLMQKELLDTAYEMARERIVNLDKEKNTELLKKLIERHGSEGARILSAKKDEEIVKKLSSLEYAGNIDCLGGIVIENSDSTVIHDYTFDSILKEVNERSLREMYRKLFEE